MPAAEDFSPGTIQARMDRMYAPQIPVYDLTRKYYLLGRDRLIAGIDARPGEALLEVGCGTGRNLAAIGRRYPGVALHGLDAAAPMLAAAERTLRKGGVADRTRLARGVAEALDLERLFGRAEPVDHVVVSYTLSMVDDPEAALRMALQALRPGGRLHLIDFSDGAGLPAWFRRMLTGWLARFGVRHRPEVEAYLRRLAAAGEGRLEVAPVGGRYALLMRLTTSSSRA